MGEGKNSSFLLASFRHPSFFGITFDLRYIYSIGAITQIEKWRAESVRRAQGSADGYACM